MKYALWIITAVVAGALIIVMTQKHTLKNTAACLFEFDVPAENGFTNMLSNQGLFSEIGAVDGTQIEHNERKRVAVVTAAGLEQFDPREIVKQLIGGEAVTTYWHVGSHICVTNEEDSDDAYIAHITGTHEYFTNERNIGEFAFAVTIDKETGVVEVVGE